MENNDMHKQDVSTSTTNSSISSATDLAISFNKVVTARLVLRRLQSKDGPAIFRVHGDPATNLYNPYGPHPDLATSEEMLRECLQHWGHLWLRDMGRHTCAGEGNHWLWWNRTSGLA